MKSNNYTIFSQQFNDISHPWRQKNREPLPTALYPISRYSGARYKGGSLYWAFITCYFSKVQGAHSLLQAYNKLQIHCCETLLQLQNIGKTLQKNDAVGFYVFSIIIIQ